MLEDDFRINFIESIRMEGRQGIMVEIVDIKHSYLILESIPFLISIINNEIPKICVFNFFIKNYNFTMEIYQKGSLMNGASPYQWKMLLVEPHTLRYKG